MRLSHLARLAPLAAVLAFAATGCQSVPSTKLNVNPQTGIVGLDSPKEITISNMVATLPNGTSFTLNGYSSHNSPDVIASVAAANAEMAKQYIEALKLLQSMAASGAMKGASGGLAP